MNTSPKYQYQKKWMLFIGVFIICGVVASIAMDMRIIQYITGLIGVVIGTFYFWKLYKTGAPFPGNLGLVEKIYGRKFATIFDALILLMLYIMFSYAIYTHL